MPTVTAVKILASARVTASDPHDLPLSETTRVFVSGLPPNFTNDQLASHFRSRFTVTDANVFADRRIGFVGFTDTTSAQNAVKYFDRSYIRMSRIAVELARPVEVVKDGRGNAVPGSKRGQMSVQDVAGVKRKRGEQDGGQQSRPDDVKRTSPEHAAIDADVLMETKEQEVPGELADQATAVPTDNDWLRGRTNRTLDLMDPEDVPVQQVPEPFEPVTLPDSQEKQATTSNDPPEQIVDAIQVPNARLFLRNLAFTVTESDLRDKFRQYGKIHEVHVVKDSRTSHSKGTAFVQFAEPYEAESALVAVDATTFQGRLLHVLPASDKRDKGLTEYEISQMPLKKQKEVRRKLAASKTTFSWNSLYMNPDAVLSSIADRLGVAKTDILDPTSADAAVKQAHAETQLIQETKDYLSAAGINPDAFKNHGHDSRCLLLKNFPYGTTEAELRTLLDKFGPLSKFLLPPTGTMALVQYEEAYQATEALKNLAYRNIKGSVLYLERGPQGIFDAQPKPASDTKQDLKPSHDDTEQDGTTSTVFVKNLNFSTTTERLKDVAGSLPGFVTARVKTRTDVKRPGEVLSMGFGFVDFRSKQDALSAVAALSGHQLDGHSLVVQLSSKSNDAAEERRKQDTQKKRDANQTKIIIKNLPFQTSKKDVRALFSQYGELKMVRVPRKFDNSTRGFAFAEFVTPKEAQNAMDALASTHLLGRRLVLDFAASDDVDPEEEIQAIERKIEQQSKRVQFNKLSGSTRKKFNVDNAQDEDLST